MSTRKVIHVELKEPIEGQRHFYFGSKKAVYSVFSSETVGISYRYLANAVRLSNGPYENKKCIIRQGWLVTTAKK